MLFSSDGLKNVVIKSHRTQLIVNLSIYNLPAMALCFANKTTNDFAKEKTTLIKTAESIVFSTFIIQVFYLFKKKQVL